MCCFTRETTCEGKNIDSHKLEAKVGVQHFLVRAFKRFYIAIWLYMLIEDIMEVLTLLLLQDFINQFVFIWGREYCSTTSGQFTTGIYYCFKN
jgi:hypothetical protein